MVRQDAFREYRALDDVLTEREQSGRGRMATVVEGDGHMVMVETATSGGAIGPYPATVSGLQPGASGVLKPLRGGQALFIATGYTQAMPDVLAIGFSHASSHQTTNISTPQVITSQTYDVTPGVWRVSAHGAGSMSRLVTSGQVYLDVDINGQAQSMIATYHTAGHIAMTCPWNGDVAISEGGTMMVTLRFRGAITAGETSCQGSSVSGMAVRIG